MEKNIISKAPKFYDEVKKEIKKVVWPSRKETTLTSMMVFIFAIVAAIYFLLVDQVIYKLLKMIIG